MLFVVLLFVLFNRASLVHTILALCLLLVIPYFYGGTMGAVRQGLGFNLVLISLMRKDSFISNNFLFALFLASLFHVIFYVFFVLILVYKVIEPLIKKEKYILPIIFLVVLIVGVSWNLLTSYLSESQKYEDFEHSTSGLTFLAWFFIFIFFVYNYIFLKKSQKIFNEDVYKFSLILFFVFLVFYWLAPGPYRILYSCTPILVCALLNNFNKYSAMCYFSIFLFCSLLIYIGAGAGTMNIDFIRFISIVFYGA